MGVEIQNSFSEVSYFVSLPPMLPCNIVFLSFLPHTASPHTVSSTAQMRDRDGWPGTLWANFNVLGMLGVLRPCFYPWAEQTPPTQGAHSLIRNNHSKDKSNKQLIVYRGT